MATLPWQTHRPAAPECRYVALLSYLPLERLQSLPWFLVYTLRIRRQLRDSSGLVGYSLRAELAHRRFWTLSAWEDEAALQAFVMAAPHAAVMHALLGHMGPTRFTRWTVKGAELPLRWDDALKHGQPAGSNAPSR